MYNYFYNHFLMKPYSNATRFTYISVYGNRITYINTNNNIFVFYLQSYLPHFDCKLHSITLYYTILYYITLYYTILHYITLHYTRLHYITLHYTILHYITPYYTTLHYITLH